MQYGHRTLNTLPPLPLFATLNLTRVALTSSLHSYVSSCHSQTPNTLRGGWALTLSTFLQWDHMSSHADASLLELHCPELPADLGMQRQSPIPHQCREEAWSCCRGAVAVAVKRSEEDRETAADLSSSLPSTSVWLSALPDRVLDLSQHMARVVEPCAAWADSGMQTDPRLFLSLWTWERHSHSWNGVRDAHHSSTAFVSVLLLSISLSPHEPTYRSVKPHSTNTTLHNVRMIASKASVKFSNLITFAGLPSLPVCVYQECANTWTS